MNRILTATTAAVAVLLLAACGSSTAAGPAGSGSSSSSTGSSSGQGRLGRNGTAGELVKIDGSTLILNTQSGDASVDVSNATIQKTSTGTVADIVQGSCVVITGRKDSTGAIAATMVRLSQPVNGSCAAANGGFGGPGGPGGGGAGRRTPNPSASPGAANFAGVHGQVSAVSGTQVTVQPTTGAAQTVTVPSTVQVSRSESATVSDLGVGDCILATGSKDSTGTVAARSVQIVPAGPSGCFTGGFGRGGGGGGGFGGGGGNGGGAGGGGSATAD